MTTSGVTDASVEQRVAKLESNLRALEASNLEIHKQIHRRIDNVRDDSIKAECRMDDRLVEALDVFEREVFEAHGERRRWWKAWIHG